MQNQSHGLARALPLFYELLAMNTIGESASTLAPLFDTVDIRPFGLLSRASSSPQAT
jgi:hypothetical protein